MPSVISLGVEQLLIGQINIYIAFHIKILYDLDNWQDCDKLDRVVLNSNTEISDVWCTTLHGSFLMNPLGFVVDLK